MMESLKGLKLKLCSHQKQHYKDIELLVNVKDFGHCVKEGDIIEIYHPEEDENQPRLLMQIPHYEEENVVTKDAISVEQSIASTFQLRPYKDVLVNKVDPKSVALELLDLTFKDQYLSRSDMWRLRMSLINTVTYINKKIDFCNNSIRCQAYEMWARGEQVACGVFTEDTKVVFRSSTCQAYLFLQMSSEMWEFDMYGDLYFEKAVNGFLAELFTKWKLQGSNHDVTIVMFSRTYYKASSLEEFPLRMRDCLQRDHHGRFYEDFYRVAVQSERYDDWMPQLIHLRQLFHSYRDDVLRFHATGDDDGIPEAVNSTAMEGNFMEVLNISLNVFEKHYFDRSFERTGQMSVVITPGVGVFEVNRELMKLTKQRIIDNGVGSDLVCLGEQPLHEVPLLKLSGNLNADDYSIPNTWINHSFYTSKKRVPGCNLFVPRIKVPQKVLKDIERGNSGTTAYRPPQYLNFSKNPGEERRFVNSIRDMDDFDNQVFKLPNRLNQSSSRHYSSLQRTPARKKSASQSSSQPPPPPRVSYQRKYSDSEIHQPVPVAKSTMNENMANQLANVAINIPKRPSDEKSCSFSYGNLDSLNIEAGAADKKATTQSDVEESRIGSSGANSPCETSGWARPPRRSLINPFNQSRVPMKDTSNSRRWTHTFPKDPTGHLIHQHRYQRASAHLSDDDDSSDISNGNIRGYGPLHDGFSHTDDPPLNGHAPFGHSTTTPSSSRTTDGWAIAGATSASSSLASAKFTNSPSKYTSQYPQGVHSSPLQAGCLPQAIPGSTAGSTLASLWGGTGKRDSNTETKTGVDWKSLILPACLPLTTDYYPDEMKMKNDYEVAGKYTRVPDNLDSVFLEMVSQRLSQGFQLIVGPEMEHARHHRHNSLLRTARRAPADTYPDDVKKEYILSIGEVFHEVQLKNSSIEVNIYRPKHPLPHLKEKYIFRFRSPYLTQYEVSRGEFKTERLENFKWSTLDEYIYSRGEQPEDRLSEEMKYWRSRLIVLPDFFKTETKKLIEFPTNIPCDMYHTLSSDELQNTTENFVRFMEVMNRLKRTGNTKKSWGFTKI